VAFRASFTRKLSAVRSRHAYHDAADGSLSDDVPAPSENGDTGIMAQRHRGPKATPGQADSRHSESVALGVRSPEESLVCVGR
jgi:hypothetical protein